MDIFALDLADEGMRVGGVDAIPAPLLHLLGVHDFFAALGLGPGKVLLLFDGGAVAPDALFGVTGSEPFQRVGKDRLGRDRFQLKTDEIIFFRRVDGDQIRAVNNATFRLLEKRFLSKSTKTHRKDH